MEKNVPSDKIIVKFILESRVFLPDGTEHRASQSSLCQQSSESRDCISIQLPNFPSGSAAQSIDTFSKRSSSQQVEIARTPQWMIGSKGHRGLLSRQNAVSRSSTPDSTPRLLSPADGQAYTPMSLGGLTPYFARGFSPRGSVCWPQGSQDEPNANRSELLPSLPGAEWSEKPTCHLQRSSSSVTTRPDPNNLWKESMIEPGSAQTPPVSSSSGSASIGLLVGSHLSRSKSHPRPRSHHDLDDINMFDPYPRQTSDDSSPHDYNRTSLMNIHQSDDKSDSLMTDSATDEKIHISKLFSSGEDSMADQEKKTASKCSTTKRNPDFSLSYSDSLNSDKGTTTDGQPTNPILHPDASTKLKAGDDISLDVGVNSDRHSTTLSAPSPSIVCEEPLPEISTSLALPTTSLGNDVNISGESWLEKNREEPSENSRNQCTAESSAATSPVRPNFLSLPSKRMTLGTLTLPVTSLNAKASLSLNVGASSTATPSEQQEKMPITTTSASLLLASSTSPAQKTSTMTALPNRPASVDAPSGHPGTRHRRCADIGRMRAISDSDESLTTDKS